MRRIASGQLSSSISQHAITPKFSQSRKIMSKVFYNLAKKNYPQNWNREMVDNFHDIGRLTDEEYADVISEDDPDD